MKIRVRTILKVLATLFIVAVVAAVVLPSYGDYRHRAQLSEAIGLMGAAKTPLAEYFQDLKRWPNKLDEVASATSGIYTQSVVISKGAGEGGDIQVVATMRSSSDGVDSRVAGKTVQITSVDHGKTWLCRSANLPDKYLPTACRRESVP